MLKYLAYYSDSFGPLRVFDSITFRASLGLAFGFFLTLLLGPVFIRALSGLRVLEDVNKPESDELAKLHQGKRHTPTMGGILMVIPLLWVTLLLADPFSPYIIMALFTVLSFAGLGLADDYIKLRGLGQHRGLSRRAKLLCQSLLACLVGMAVMAAGHEDTVTRLCVPGTKFAEFQPDLGGWYLLFFVLVMVAASNAVNLTDGLDGLAGGCTSLVGASFCVMAYVAGNVKLAAYLKVPYVTYSGELTIFCAILVGTTLGFLWYNAHPARVFMGDTGSLSLGAAIGFVALATKQEFVLPVVGGVFVWEALSVILQIGFFKTRGRRLFRCAPFHHHLEFSGWNENHVVVRLWLVSIVLTTLGLATLKMH